MNTITMSEETGVTTIIPGRHADGAGAAVTAKGPDAIRPFHIDVPEEALVDLRRRIAATRWPDKETVSDASQGVQLATMKALARHWATDHDWRKCEAKLNALPQFITEIDGLDIHFIHVRSKQKKCVAAHRYTRVARFDHRATEDYRSTYQSHRAWRERIRRFRSGDSLDAGLWVFRQADRARLGPGPHRKSVDSADEATGIH